MKVIKLISFATAVLSILASCERQEINGPDAVMKLVPVTLTASYDILTKVSYTETNSDGIKLNPAWEENDNIIGFDGENNTYTFVVSEVDETTGEATLIGEAPASCTLHLIYLCGAEATSIVSSSLSVSYKDQKGDKTMPAVMLADGEVSDGNGEFTFHNAGAVIGIKSVNGVPEGSTISKITVSGENLSDATVALIGNTLALTATEKSYDSISTGEDFTAVTVADANGTLSTSPIFIAVPANAIVKEICVISGVDAYAFTLSTPETLAANQYSYVDGQKFNNTDYVIVGDLKWMKENLAITESGKREFNKTGHINGDFFQWAAHENYALPLTDLGNGKTDNGLLLYSSFESKATGYTNNKFYYKSGKKFEKASAPYNVQGGTYSKYNSEDEKFTLETIDDAASIILGGSWRIPYIDDFQALLDATYCAWDTNDKGIYVFIPDETHSANGLSSSLGDLDKADAVLFFPATGYAPGSLTLVFETGYSMVRNRYEENVVSINWFHFKQGVTEFTHNYRYWGGTIRPVCPVSE